MKLTSLSIAAALVAVLLGSATMAEAGPRFSFGISSGGYSHGYTGGYSHGYSSGHGYGYSGGYNSGYYSSGGSYHSGGHCAPYKVSTVEVNRCSHVQTAYDNCGRPYSYRVTVVTYCDRYSDGTSRTWTRTYS